MQWLAVVTAAPIHISSHYIVLSQFANSLQAQWHDWFFAG
jgi:hypothetical protein